MARQKEVFTDVRTIAHAWYHQTQGHARNGTGNFYFSGDTIYSYGSHFPIARIVRSGKGSHKGERAVLLTTRGYSNTTARHIHAVRMAIPSGARVFSTEDPKRTEADVMAEYSARIGQSASGITRERIRDTTKARIFAETCGLVAEANQYAEFIGSRKRFKTPESVSALAELAERTNKAEERERKRKEERARQEYLTRTAKDRAEYAEAVPLWLNGERSRLPWNPDESRTALLRISPDDPEAVETSLGASFPVSHAVRALRIIARLSPPECKCTDCKTCGAVRMVCPECKQCGRCADHLETCKSGCTAGSSVDAPLFVRNGRTIHLGHFQIDRIDADGRIHAGCHEVTKEERERFADVLRERGCMDRAEVTDASASADAVAETNGGAE